MKPTPARDGDPVCPSCGGGPYTRHGSPKPFIRGLCVTCWAVDHLRPERERVALPSHLKPAGNAARLAEVRRARKRAVAPVCGLSGCDEPCVLRCYGDVSEQWSRRCEAHQGMNVAVHAPYVHKPIMKACAGCGVLVSRLNRRAGRSFCSELCRKYVVCGPWFSKLPVRRVPKIVVRSPSYEFECAWCGMTCASQKSSQRFCSHDHKMRARYARRWAARHDAPGEYTWMDVTRLWRKFGGCCAYCGGKTPLVDIQAEHVVALSNGGSNSTTNLLPSCGSCNSNKRDLTLVEWAAFRQLRGLPAVVTIWDATDSRYSHLVLDVVLAVA